MQLNRRETDYKKWSGKYHAFCAGAPPTFSELINFFCFCGMLLLYYHTEINIKTKMEIEYEISVVHGTNAFARIRQ